METIDLSALFSTKSQAEDFALRLQMIVEKAFETSFNPDKALMEHFGIQKKEMFMKMLRENKVNPESRLAIKEFIEKLQEKIRTLPVLSIILAFEPTDETLQTFSRWFIINTKKHVLFDVKIDPALIGGAAIYANGKYLDFSIRPTFMKILTASVEPQQMLAVAKPAAPAPAPAAPAAPVAPKS